MLLAKLQNCDNFHPNEEFKLDDGEYKYDEKKEVETDEDKIISLPSGYKKTQSVKSKIMQGGNGW